MESRDKLLSVHLFYKCPRRRVTECKWQVYMFKYSFHVNFIKSDQHEHFESKVLLQKAWPGLGTGDSVCLLALSWRGTCHLSHGLEHEGLPSASLGRAEWLWQSHTASLEHGITPSKPECWGCLVRG